MVISAANTLAAESIVAVTISTITILITIAITATTEADWVAEFTLVEHRITDTAMPPRHRHQPAAITISTEIGSPRPVQFRRMDIERS